MRSFSSFVAVLMVVGLLFIGGCTSSGGLNRTGQGAAGGGVLGGLVGAGVGYLIDGEDGAIGGGLVGAGTGGFIGAGVGNHQERQERARMQQIQHQQAAARAQQPLTGQHDGHVNWVWDKTANNGQGGWVIQGGQYQQRVGGTTAAPQPAPFPTQRGIGNGN